MDAQAQCLTRLARGVGQQHHAARRLDPGEPVLFLRHHAARDHRARLAHSQSGREARVRQDLARGADAAQVSRLDQRDGGGEAGDLGRGVADIENGELNFVT